MKKNLNKKFTILFLSVLFVVFVVLLVTVAITANASTRHYIDADISQSLESVNTALTDTLNETNYCYTRILQSTQLETIAAGGDQSTLQAEFESMLADCYTPSDYINVVMKINEDVFSLSQDYDLPSKSFIKKIVDGKGTLQCDISAAENFVRIGRRLQNSRLGIDGYIVFYLSVDTFNENCSVLDTNLGMIIVVDNSNTVMASSNGQNFGKTFVDFNPIGFASDKTENTSFEGQKMFVRTEKIDNQYNLDWYITCMLYSKVVQRDFVTLMWILTGIAVIIFAVALLVALRVSKAVVAPINKLSAKISSVDFQRRKGLVDIGSPGDELYELERNYAEMIDRLFLLMDENKQNMETQRKLEIDALQMQINPHFLYNTLDAIAWMAKIKKQPEIEKLVINLARFFRLSLHKGAKYITISEETEIVEHFLEIEKIRFPDTIKYICNIPEGVGEYKTLKLILQPIVENCVKHGFVGKQGIGTITVSVATEGDDIVFSVMDDGCGFEVSKDFWEKKPDKPNGYGLTNVNERIRLEYGEGYGLTINSAPGKGTTVYARIKKSL